MTYRSIHRLTNIVNIQDMLIRVITIATGRLSFPRYGCYYYIYYMANEDVVIAMLLTIIDFYRLNLCRIIIEVHMN